jgi:hypothetical protein
MGQQGKTDSTRRRARAGGEFKTMNEMISAEMENQFAKILQTRFRRFC